MNMHKLFFLFLFSLLFSFAKAQSDDKALNTRLNEYMAWSSQLNFEKIMDYIHPSLFRIIPKQTMLEALKAPFESNEVKVTLDSLAVLEVSPVFTHNSSDYRKVKYRVVMDMYFTDKEAVENNSFIDLVLSGLQGEFPDSKVSFDKSRKSFHISGTDILIAIKDKNTQWMFVGTEKDNELMDKLFAKEVREKFQF